MAGEEDPQEATRGIQADQHGFASDWFRVLQAGSASQLRCDVLFGYVPPHIQEPSLQMCLKNEKLKVQRSQNVYIETESSQFPGAPKEWSCLHII